MHFLEKFKILLFQIIAYVHTEIHVQVYIWQLLLQLMSF